MKMAASRKDTGFKTEEKQLGFARHMARKTSAVITENVKEIPFPPPSSAFYPFMFSYVNGPTFTVFFWLFHKRSPKDTYGNRTCLKGMLRCENTGISDGSPRLLLEMSPEQQK